VVHDQIGRADGVDGERIAAQLVHGVPHGGEVDQGGDAREVLQDDAGRFERDLDPLLVLLVLLPVEDLLHVFFGDVEPVAVADGRFEEDSDRKGQTICARWENNENRFN